MKRREPQGTGPRTPSGHRNEDVGAQGPQGHRASPDVPSRRREDQAQVELSVAAFDPLLLREHPSEAFVYHWLDLDERLFLKTGIRGGPPSEQLPDVLLEAMPALTIRSPHVTRIQLRGSPVTDALRKRARELGLHITEATDTVHGTPQEPGG